VPGGGAHFQEQPIAERHAVAVRNLDVRDGAGALRDDGLDPRELRREVGLFTPGCQICSRYMDCSLPWLHGLFTPGLQIVSYWVSSIECPCKITW
jgi:hypothetical protein